MIELFVFCHVPLSWKTLGFSNLVHPQVVLQGPEVAGTVTVD